MLPEYKTILYATDLTENAGQAFRHAVAIAEKFDATIHILHMLPEIDSAVINLVSNYIGEERMAELELERKDELVEVISRRLKAFVEKELGGHTLPEGCIGAIKITHGDPAVGILEESVAIKADLIVLGSHGKGPLSHVIVGSVSKRVIQKARCPVFISRLVS